MRLSEGLATGAFWLVVAALALLKAVLVSDLPVHVADFPHDDSTYVTRALHLLQGAAFGPYDSHTLSKLPGISFWLAGARWTGIPHLLAINALYLAAGLYFLSGLRRAGAAGPLPLLLIFALFLFNPVTLSEEWHRVLREPLGTGLFVVMLAAMLHLFLATTGPARVWPHAVVLSLAFGFGLILREDDRLLWAALALFAIGLARASRVRAGPRYPGSGRVLAAAVLAPAAAALLVNLAARSFVESHYGLPILHDMSQGEFPRLVAGIRSVDSPVDNRLVMASQDTLKRLRAAIPEFAPVVDRLPPPGVNTVSCRLQGVCSEWSNGWLLFWIKDAADSAGLTPSLAEGQRYFRDVRDRIEQACASGTLKCSDRGEGVLPAFELRWTRAFVTAFARLVRLAVYPETGPILDLPLVFDVPVSLGRTFQAVTMTSKFDSLAQTSVTGALDRPLYISPIAAWRAPLSAALRIAGAIVIVAGLVALAVRWAWYPSAPETATLWIVTLFFAYSALRLAALAYVTVYMGPFDSRMVFVTYTGALLCGPLAIAELLRAAKSYRAHRV